MKKRETDKDKDEKDEMMKRSASVVSKRGKKDSDTMEPGT
jgi:hypothetical protein